MSAVDASDIHAAPGEIEDEVGIGRRLSRQRDHDAAAAMRASAAQQPLRHRAELRLAGKKLRF
ncbi:hypothetical protein D3C71_2114400 [compost metagenome]